MYNVVDIMGVTWRSLGTNPASTAARVAPTKQKRRKNPQITLSCETKRQSYWQQWYLPIGLRCIN